MKKIQVRKLETVKTTASAYSLDPSKHCAF